MQLRIHDIVKSKGMTLKELSEILGITNVGLSQQINGNPTIETLKKIADALNVDFLDLFVNDSNNEIIGIVRFNNKSYEINSKEDIENLLKEITILGGKGEV